MGLLRQREECGSLRQSAFSVRQLFPRLLLLCAALLAFPGVATAQPAPLTILRLWAQDSAGNAKAAFAPGEPIQFIAQLSNSYGGALPSSQLTLTTTFYNDDKPVSIPAGVSTWTWTATAPSTQNIYTISLKALDTFYGTWATRNAILTVGTAQHPPLPPAPNWYSNSGAGGGQSTIDQESSGLTITWGNSYIFLHPGDSNLYWYAEVTYLNMGNQPLPITCNGRADPSIAKEWIRGTEGIAPGSSGYVAAEETFCSRNPSYTGSLEPGAAHLEWAIFHNVPPDGAVSLEWGPYGVSLWLDPWYSAFPADVPPPAVCPPELVTLGNCHPAEQPDQGAPEFYCIGGTPGKQGKECSQRPVVVKAHTQPAQSSELIQSRALCTADVLATGATLLVPVAGEVIEVSEYVGTAAIGIVNDVSTGQNSKAILEFIPYKSCFELAATLMPVQKVE